jgi:hypothetical protein
MADTKISALTSKAAPIGADVTNILDSAAGNADKKVTLANLPISTATQSALDLKAPLASPALTGTPTAPTQAAGDNSTKIATTAYADAKVADAIANGVTTIAPSQNAVFDALALKQDSLPAGTADQFLRGSDKTFVVISSNQVGLGNVNNTSDANKPISTAQQAEFNKRIFGSISADVVELGTALVNCGLSFAIGANEKWAVTWQLLVTTNASNASAFGISAPAGASGRARYQGSTTVTGTTTSPKPDLTATSAIFFTSASEKYMEVVAVIENGATAGTIDLQFQPSGAQTTTIRKESFFTANRLA